MDGWRKIAGETTDTFVRNVSPEIFEISCHQNKISYYVLERLINFLLFVRTGACEEDPQIPEGNGETEWSQS